jgi:hypothetical protein
MGINRVPKVCLINQDDKKCEGIADCVEGMGRTTLEKIGKFLEG